MALNNRGRLCRLCLCSSKRFIDVMEENGDLGFIAARAIEDLLQLKVQKLGNYPWLACSTCLEKLIDFKLFKSRCVDSIVTFEKRFRQLHGGKKGPQNDEKAVRNESETIQEGDESENEEAGVSDMCQVLMQSDTPDHLASRPAWHSNGDENVSMAVHDTCSNGLKSCERNTDDRRGDIDIEEGGIVKEEPQDADESGSPLGGRSMDIKEEPQDMEENDSTYPPKVPGICQINSVLGDANMSINSHSIEPLDGDNEGNEMVSPIEKRGMDSKEESSNKLEDGNHHIVEGFYCVFCTAVLDTEKTLRDHIAEHEEGRWRNQSGSKCPATKINVDGTYPVALVNLRPLNLYMNASGNSKKLVSVAKSMYDHCRKKSFKCKKCSRVFPSLMIFKHHKSSCKANECSRCKKTFTSQYYLLNHLKVEKSNEVFSCPKCSKSFNYKCELKAHKQVHTKVFVCKDCQCVFDRYYSLKEHILTHCKVKPLVCKDCQETFIGSHALRKHRAEVHNGRSSRRGLSTLDVID